MKIKKILFGMLCIANIGFVQAQYTAIPDPAFELRLIELGIDSDNLINQSVLTSDIANVIGLDLSFASIYDTTGIQDFTALEILDCNYNYFTSLDISQNVQLKKLYCIDNQLTTLDISYNTLIERVVSNNNQINIFVHGNNLSLYSLELSNNSISTINISGLVNLESFGCTNNPLTSLDLTSNNLLKSFGCIGNQNLTTIDLRNGNNQIITFFNVTNNPNLTCIFVDDAVYSTSNWLDIDATSTFVETQEACNVLEIKEFTIKNLVIYPNPVRDYIYIKNDSFIAIKTVKIYTVLGKEIINSNLSAIDVSKLEKGMYYIHLIAQNGETVTKKMTKI